MRQSGRRPDQLREISIETNVNKFAEGSCLIKLGDTHVICTASVEDRLPGWLRDKGQGWITAEYGMLPRSTGERTNREASRGKQGGRTLEIQRLIGRSLRAAVDLDQLNELQIRVDCDVIQADGGTRTASVTGGFVALYEACKHLKESGKIANIPINQMVAAISCGFYNKQAYLDLDYLEDSNADSDTNFVMTENNEIIEIQGTAEKAPLSQEDLYALIKLAQQGIREITVFQRKILGV